MALHKVKLLKKEEIASGTMAFTVEKPAGFEFRAGQFCDWTLLNPSETDAEGNTRGFSIVAAPYESTLSFATRMRDTAFKRVLKDLPIGTEIQCDGPYGDFRLHNNASTPAVFLIGGIGITPVHSIIAQATHDKTAHDITLLHANPSPEMAPFAESLTRLAKENPHFTFVPVFDAPSGAGERGRIDSAMVKRHVADTAKPIYYLSGPEGMVKAMRKLLTEELHVDEDNIRTEEFSGY